MNILITSAGQRVSLVRAFESELKKQFPSSKVFTADMSPELSPACNVSDRYFKLKKVTDPLYITELLELCISENIRMVIPTIDTELQVLADHKEIFEKVGIFVVISSPEFVSKCRDKRKINKFFQTLDINIPKEIDKNAPVFPLFIKPYDGSLSVDSFHIKNAEEITNYHINNEKLLFMEYIDKVYHDEYTVDMYYGKDNYLKCIVPRKRIHIRAGEVNKGVTCKNIIVPFCKEKLNYVKGVIGCQTLQLFLNRDNFNIIAIEINPRFGGGYPLSYQAGANFPAYLIKEYFMNVPIEYTEDWEENLLMLRYDDEILIHGYKC
ncbi:MAG: carbamoyl phosphate synthase large subunit [Mucilaginibacter sp.]|nr:carbamoyl phosphate synthase large subunit [Mucilaginibacter sp.]